MSSTEPSGFEHMSRRLFLRASGLAAGFAGLPGATAPAAAESGPVFKTLSDLTLSINGRATSVRIEPRTSLLDLLRERLALTGTKKGCNEGACGACTVLLDGARVNACLTLAVSCEGCEVTTVEGLADADGTLSAVQQAFIDHDAFQCGYCTPGQVVSATACIREGHATDEAAIREWMSGNLCRCAAYPQITAAVLDAAGRSRADAGRAAVNG